MATICAPNCTDAPITRYNPDCNVTSSFRKGGLATFIALDCAVQFEDVTSASEWEALSLSQFFVAPSGIGEWTEPELTTEAVDCAPDYTTDEISGANFQIKKFDNEEFKDLDMEYDLKTQLANKTVLFVDCNDIVYYNRAWTPGDNPGFAGIAPSISRVSARGALQALNVNFTYNTFQTGMKAFRLTPELKEAIFR